MLSGLLWAQTREAAAQPQPPVLRLSLKDAAAIALGADGNAQVRLAQEIIQQAKSLADQSRAALLPNISASVGQQDATRNLKAFGIDIQNPATGLRTPTFVGPFGVFDARATGTQTVLNLGMFKRYQASRSGIGLAEAENEEVQDQIRFEVARAYLAAVRAQASVEAALADVTLSEALLDLAAHQKSVGTGTGIDVTRAGVQLANQRQRLLVVQNEKTQAHLRLLKTLGVGMDIGIELIEPLSYAPAPPPDPQQEIERAWRARSDWQAQQKRVETSQLNLSATKLEIWPSLSIFGDYGTIGSSINEAVPTRTFGFIVDIPVFDGGRSRARRAEDSSRLRQERIAAQDLRAQIELEVRVALDNLTSADDQVRAAEEGLTLALRELEQAQRRYRAGVATNIETIDAQTRIERARENKISALFNFNLARIELLSATGAIRQITD